MATIAKYTTQSGETRFRALVRLTGHPTATKVFRLRGQAENWAREVEDSIRTGKAPAREAKRPFAEHLAAYLPELAGRKSPETERALYMWRELLGDYSLERVSKDLIIRHLDRFRSEGNAPATLNRKLSALSVFLGWAKERGLISSNPAREIKRAKENNMRHRYLTDDERINLWNAAKEVDPRMYGLIVTATVSGMRASEMLGLRWADVDFDHEHITLHTTKNDEPRIVPLTGPALKVLRARKNGQRPSERVFGVGTFPRHLWRQALKAAGIDDLRFHDLRHSAASFLVQHGVDIRVVADILGHRTITTTMRYAHVATKTTRAALNSTWADVSD